MTEQTTTETPELVSIHVRIENVYEDGDTVNTIETANVPAPDAADAADEYAEWAEEHVYPLTGTDREDGDAAYFATITRCDAVPALVGREFEWGV